MLKLTILFVVQQKLSPTVEFKLKFFDQILDIVIWNCWGSRTGNSKRRARLLTGVANTFLRGCDLLKEDIEELGKKLGIKNDEHLDKNWTIYFD